MFEYPLFLFYDFLEQLLYGRDFTFLFGMVLEVENDYPLKLSVTKFIVVDVYPRKCSFFLPTGLVAG